MQKSAQFLILEIPFYHHLYIIFISPVLHLRKQLYYTYLSQLHIYKNIPTLYVSLFLFFSIQCFGDSVRGHWKKKSQQYQYGCFQK